MADKSDAKELKTHRRWNGSDWVAYACKGEGCVMCQEDSKTKTKK